MVYIPSICDRFRDGGSYCCSKNDCMYHPWDHKQFRLPTDVLFFNGQLASEVPKNLSASDQTGFQNRKKSVPSGPLVNVYITTKVHHAIHGKTHELSTGPWLQVRKLLPEVSSPSRWQSWRLQEICHKQDLPPVEHIIKACVL